MSGCHQAALARASVYSAFAAVQATRLTARSWSSATRSAYYLELAEALSHLPALGCAALDHAAAVVVFGRHAVAHPPVQALRTAILAILEVSVANLSPTMIVILLARGPTAPPGSRRSRAVSKARGTAGKRADRRVLVVLFGWANTWPHGLVPKNPAVDARTDLVGLEFQRQHRAVNEFQTRVSPLPVIVPPVE